MTLRRATELALAIGSALMIAACGSPIRDRIALVGVTVIDGTDGPARDDQVVIIRGSKIDTIAPEAGFTIPKTAMVVDLKGKWVIPGLIDVDGAVERWAIPRYLAFGVTTVRDVGNDQDSIVALAEAASLHSLVSPRLFVTGAALDGTAPFDPSSVALTSESAARRAVDDRIQGSATFVSVGPGLTSAILHGVVDEATSLNTAVTARLGLTDARTAAKLGIKSLLELSGVPQSVVDPAPFYAAYRRSPWEGWTATERAWAGLDSAPLGAVAADLAATGVTLVPALVLHDTWSRLDDSTVTASPNLAYVPVSARAEWDVARAEAQAGWNASTFPAFRAGRSKQDLFLREFKLAGGRIATGTGASRLLIVPGVSLHRELKLLVDAGLPPDDALRDATSVAAALIGADSLGTLEPGKVADLLVLDADPRIDIRNARRIRKVILGGTILDADSLMRRIRQ